MAYPMRFLSDVSVFDPFWGLMRDTVRKEGILYQWEALNDRLPDTEPSYCMRNFRIAAGKEAGGHGGCVFQDSDVAKWLESVAYTLAWHPDPELEAIADGAIDDVVAAQQPDGYMDTYYIINGLDKRWTNLTDNHELYCAGHMVEAAVAYYQATGKRKLLDAVIRLVDHIDQNFGPEPEKKQGYPGHPILEMALVRLYDVTGDPRHLKLAAYLVNQRGQAPLYFEEEMKHIPTGFRWKGSPFGYQYYQAGKPVREQTVAEGHAVRAVYLYSGMADVARLTEDDSLRQACETLWNNIVRKQMYITGAIGSSEYGEAFTFDYDLPNDTVYGETCASIALVFFAKRMLMMQPKGEYADVMERALYNCIIAGMQLDGKKFFYVNPLEVSPLACQKDYNKRHVMPQRQKWFACACCPPNLNRMLASLEQYVYAADDATLYQHLYMGTEGKVQLGGGEVAFRMETNYPWQGEAAVTFATVQPVRFRYGLRIPGWCRKYQIRVNGGEIPFTVEDGYAVIDREWAEGDKVEITFDMPVQLNRANPRVAKDAGLCAVSRGPIVYCLEGVDNGDDLHAITLEGVQAADFKAETSQEFGREMVLLTSPGWRENDEGWGEELYSPDIETARAPVTLKWIPYFAWANRAMREMRVWIRR